MYEFLPLGSIYYSGISGEIKLLSPTSPNAIYTVHQAVGTHSHIHFYSYHFQTKTTTLLQKIVCESSEVIETVFYANSQLLNQNTKLFYFTYFNSLKQRFQTDAIINDSNRVNICHSKDYHQLEVISSSGVFIMISKKNRIRILKLRLKANRIETSLLQDLGKTIWYQYIPNDMKLVFLTYNNSIKKKSKEGQSDVDELSSTRSSSRSTPSSSWENSSISRLEAYSLKQAPTKIQLLYRYSIVLSYTPTMNDLFPSILPNDIEPIHHYPRFFNEHMNCQVLTLENGTDVLCRHFRHPMDPENHIKISLFLFKNKVNGRISFDLKINRKKFSVMKHISYIVQRNIIFIIVSGHYFKAVDCSNGTPKSLFTLQPGTDPNDIIPKIPVITNDDSSDAELPLLVQLNESNLSNEFFSKALKKGLVSVVLNANDGRLFAMRLSTAEANRYVLQQNAGISSLIYLSNYHLGDCDLATMLLRTVCTQATFFPVHLIEAMQEYIISTSYVLASEKLPDSEFLSLIPNSYRFPNNSDGEEPTVYNEIAKIFETYPYGPREWKPLWLESQERVINGKSTQSPLSSQHVSLDIFDFLDKSPSDSQPVTNSGFSGFLKSLLQMRTKDEVVKQIQDPYAMSQRWLFFTTLNNVFNDRITKAKRKNTNQKGNPDSPRIPSKPWLATSWCKSFTLIISQITADVYKLLQSVKREIQNPNDNQPSTWYLNLLESLHMATKECGFPIPENFTFKIAMEAYKYLPQRIFLQYVENGVLLIDTRIVQKIVSLEASDSELIFRLAKNLYYKGLYDSNTLEEQHVEIQKEISLLQKSKKRRKDKFPKAFLDDRTPTPTSRSSGISETSEASDTSEVSDTDSLEGPMNSHLNGTVFSCYQSYNQISPIEKHQDGVFTFSPTVSSPLSYSNDSQSKDCTPKQESLL